MTTNFRTRCRARNLTPASCSKEKLFQHHDSTIKPSRGKLNKCEKEPEAKITMNPLNSDASWRWKKRNLSRPDYFRLNSTLVHIVAPRCFARSTPTFTDGTRPFSNPWLKGGERTRSTEMHTRLLPLLLSRTCSHPSLLHGDR